MKGRSTCILLIAALLLGGWIYLTDRRAALIAVVGKGDQEVRFRRIDHREILEIEILGAHTAARLVRTNAQWWLQAPVFYPAQSAAVESFLESLGAMVPRTHLSSAELATKPGAMEAFGLVNPDVLTLRSRSGLTLIRIGAKTALGNQVYFQRVGEDGVFTADARILGAIPTTVDGWRDHRLLAGQTDDFDRLEVSGTTGFEAVRATNGVWTLIRPLLARANSEQINWMLTELAGLSATSFVTDSMAAAEDFGLAKPAVQVALKKGTNELIRLQIGGISSNRPGELFVRRVGPGNIVIVTNSITDLLRQPLASFRDRRFLPSVAGVTRIAMGIGTNQFIVDREGTNWVTTAPRRFLADPLVMRDVLRRFVGLQIDTFADDLATDLTRYGLNNPVRTYEFSANGTGSLTGGIARRSIARLEFGTPTTDGRRVYARRSDESGVYEVPAGDFSILPVTAAQLRDFVFDPTNTIRIEIRHQGRLRILNRTASGHWDGSVSIGATLADPAIDECLYRLSRAAGGRFPEPDSTALKQFAFAQVGHSLTLVLKEGGPFRSLNLHFGGRPNAVNQFVLARFDEEPEGVLTQFPLQIYQEYVGPWLSAVTAVDSGSPP